MSIVTRTGDKGETGLYGTKRIAKDSPRIETTGTVDELNAEIGMVLAYDNRLPLTLLTQLMTLQHRLFQLGADLATPMEAKTKVKRIDLQHIEELEKWTFALEDDLPPLRAFILPGGSKLNAMLHIARTVCRRAERDAVSLSKTENINLNIIIYLNRLSDFLFLAARKVSAVWGDKETEVEYV